MPGVTQDPQIVSMPSPDNPLLRLIQTRLHRPSVTKDLVRRPRLIELLTRGLDLALTLVSVPAGSGKTTLLSDWLVTCSCPSAWLSLDEGDSDLAAFLDYLIAAIRSIVPGARSQSLALLEQSELPSTRALAGLLANEIDALPDARSLAAGERIVPVLDDYHLVRSQAVDDLPAELLRHPLPALQLVIATRSDLAPSLSSLRARGQVLEIRR